MVIAFDSLYETPGWQRARAQQQSGQRKSAGPMTIDGDLVARFDEKPQMSEGWINGGYFVLEPAVFDYIPGDVDWAKEPLESLAAAGQLVANRHEGFWQCMDTLRDKIYLNHLWEQGNANWKVWE